MRVCVCVCVKCGHSNSYGSSRGNRAAAAIAHNFFTEARRCNRSTIKTGKRERERESQHRETSHSQRLQTIYCVCVCVLLLCDSACEATKCEEATSVRRIYEHMKGSSMIHDYPGLMTRSRFFERLSLMHASLACKSKVFRWKKEQQAASLGLCMQQRVCE